MSRESILEMSLWELKVSLLSRSSKLKVVDTFISKFRHLGPLRFTKVNTTYDIKISLYGTPTYGKSPTCLAEPKVRKQQAIPEYVVTTKTFQDVQKLAKSGVPYCMYSYFGYHW